MSSTLIAAAFIGHLILGILATLTAYKALERNWMFGWLFSLGLTGGAVLAEWGLGEELLLISSLTVAEQKLLIVTVVIGAFLGILSTVVLTKPDISRDHRVQVNEQDIEPRENS